MNKDSDIEVRYAPFDYIERSARLIIIGITPGQSQANTALERFPKSVKRFSEKKRAVNNGLERRSDSIRSKCALNALAKAKHEGKSFNEALPFAKIEASFNGTMRSTLIRMLDYIGIDGLFNIASIKAFF